MQIVSRVSQCYSPDMPRRIKADIDTVMFHRIGPCLRPGQRLTGAADIAAWFHENPETIGSPHMPYTFVITDAGVIEQALPILVKSPHAAAWNKRAVGIAVIGDFRNAQPPDAQKQACVYLLRRIMYTIGRPLKVVGHTSVPGATTDPDKICPGKNLSVDWVNKAALAQGRLQLEA